LILDFIGFPSKVPFKKARI